ncbi:hypothetical protein JR316_0012599 [Psilocybe cubensis]|uniref:Uncharacterized protein n=2 Tax=Psilocybe cubensis TaxID=181762 RepID=A0A8H7XN56_PSICU|nr:hypothetical protein JR316_0012599 [Psilocybe cubensis]KAH9475488.1 hypothetical protein JR316_0012599 [Psilocybe cubensis]
MEPPPDPPPPSQPPTDVKGKSRATPLQGSAGESSHVNNSVSIPSTSAVEDTTPASSSSASSSSTFSVVHPPHPFELAFQVDEVPVPAIFVGPFTNTPSRYFGINFSGTRVPHPAELVHPALMVLVVTVGHVVGIFDREDQIDLATLFLVPGFVVRQFYTWYRARAFYAQEYHAGRVRIVPFPPSGSPSPTSPPSAPGGGPSSDAGPSSAPDAGLLSASGAGAPLSGAGQSSTPGPPASSLPSASSPLSTTTPGSTSAALPPPPVPSVPSAPTQCASASAMARVSTPTVALDPNAPFGTQANPIPVGFGAARTRRAIRLARSDPRLASITTTARKGKGKLRIIKEDLSKPDYVKLTPGGKYYIQDPDDPWTYYAVDSIERMLPPPTYHFGRSASEIAANPPPPIRLESPSTPSLPLPPAYSAPLAANQNPTVTVNSFNTSEQRRISQAMEIAAESTWSTEGYLWSDTWPTTSPVGPSYAYPVPSWAEAMTETLSDSFPGPLQSQDSQASLGTTLGALSEASSLNNQASQAPTASLDSASRTNTQQLDISDSQMDVDQGSQ